MQKFPHHYLVSVTGAAQGDVELTAEGLPNLRSASPAEFDGPGDRWSPETFLVGAVGDCFILTFRAVARASKLPWTSLRCQVTGTLDRIDRTTQFTHLHIHARLMLPAGSDRGVARRALENTERSCLISNSLKATVHLEPEIDVATEQTGALTGVAQ
jgi:organic hydroperoxide reductase OsmC/OhrA